MLGLHYSKMASISGTSCVILALMVLVLPLKWLLAALLAAAVHELFHIASVYLAGGEVRGVTVGGRGAVISSGPLSRVKELFCVLAGPIGSLIMLFFARWLPRTAVCAAIQAAYNLLPFLNLDGGRALHCLLLFFLSEEAADRICSRVQTGFSACLILLGLYCALRLCLGWMPLVLALYISVKAGVIKIPCKTAAGGVQ